MSERSKAFLHPTTFARSEEINQAFRAAGVIFVDPLSTFCNGEGCLLTVPDGRGEPIVWDDAGHMTKEGSEYFIASNADIILNAREGYQLDPLSLDTQGAVPVGRTPP